MTLPPYEPVAEQPKCEPIPVNTEFRTERKGGNSGNPPRASAAPCPVCGTYCLGRHDVLVEAVDYPQVGERVAYTLGDGSGTVLAYVERVAAHDGDADLRIDGRPNALDVKPGHGERHTYRRIDVAAPLSADNAHTGGAS